METKFEKQRLYSIIDLTAILAKDRRTSMGVRAHADKGYFQCDFPSRGQGVPSYYSQENLLAAAVFYALTLEGMSNKPAAQILKRLPLGVWQDVRDGFTRYLVTPLSGEGGIQFLCDIEELTAPKHPAILVIDLVAIRENVIQRVEETFEKRSKSKGLK